MKGDGRFYELMDREQEQIFHPSLRRLAEDEPDVLSLDRAVQRLDLSALEAGYTAVGHPAYPPQIMVKVLVYGYSTGLRSSRQIARACRKDDAFRFLSHGLRPDFRTICRFRRRHAEALEALFVQTVGRCQEEGLVSLGHVAIDGTKVRANQSRQALGEARKRFREALREAEKADADIPDEPDPVESCPFMKTPEGTVPAYNGQVAVDSAHQVILAQALSDEAVDRGHLPQMVAKVQANCNAPPEAVSADGGYLTHATIVALDGQGIAAHLPAPKEAGRFEWADDQQAYRCPQGQFLRAVGVRNRQQIYRTSGCRGCPQAKECGVKGPFKELHRPLQRAPVDRWVQRMNSAQGQAVYAARQQIVEPVFGRFKHNWGFRRFLLRGRRGAAAEWALLCIAHNLRKWAKATFGGPQTGQAPAAFSCPACSPLHRLLRLLRATGRHLFVSMTGPTIAPEPAA